jgi:hypothetical protein
MDVSTRVRQEVYACRRDSGRMAANDMEKVVRWDLVKLRYVRYTTPMPLS